LGEKVAHKGIILVEVDGRSTNLEAIPSKIFNHCWPEKVISQTAFRNGKVVRTSPTTGPFSGPESSILLE